MEAARTVFARMTARGVRLNARTFGKLVETAARRGDGGAAVAWLEAMAAVSPLDRVACTRALPKRGSSVQRRPESSECWDTCKQFA